MGDERCDQHCLHSARQHRCEKDAGHGGDHVAGMVAWPSYAWGMSEIEDLVRLQALLNIACPPPSTTRPPE